MQKISGYFNGTDAAVYLCVGSIPRHVRLINLEVATNPISAEWDVNFVGAATAYGGLLDLTGSTYIARTKLTTTGIFPYEGGDLMTSANQTSVAYGEGVFLGWDLQDYRANKSYGCASTPINTWTMDTAGSLTGHVNDDTVSSANRIGAGSKIRIKEASSGLVKEAGITAWTAGQGVSANEVTISRNIGSGSVTFIGGMYQLAPIALGKVAPAGIYFADSSHALCDNDNTIWFEMEIDTSSPS
jgi:hypothetical protein